MLFYAATLALGLIGIYKFRTAMLIIQRRNDAKLLNSSSDIITDEQKDFKGLKRAG